MCAVGALPGERSASEGRRLHLHIMGNTLDKVDEGLYISGASALEDTARLQSEGITHILNAASEELYSFVFGRSATNTLEEFQSMFTIKCLECDDRPSENLSGHFADIADFIEVGRAAGGVVVHCAAGISRSTTSLAAYLMIKEHLSLDAALHKVHLARQHVHPNDGFWRQLRDLESVLIAQGFELEPLDEEVRASVEALREQQPSGSRGCCHAGEVTFPELLVSLDSGLCSTSPFVSSFLTVEINLAETVSPSGFVDQLRGTDMPGAVLHDCVVRDHSVCARVGLQALMDTASLTSFLERLPGVVDVARESDSASGAAGE